MNTLQRMRHAIREQRYRISSHANEEMANDFLVVADIENIILTGKIITKLTRDPRGMRYMAIPSITAVAMLSVVFFYQEFC